MTIWDILRTFGIFYEHWVNYVYICNIFPVLVSRTKKNLATLLRFYLRFLCLAAIISRLLLLDRSNPAPIHFQCSTIIITKIQIIYYIHIYINKYLLAMLN
jgi:hypothetical protein